MLKIEETFVSIESIVNLYFIRLKVSIILQLQLIGEKVTSNLYLYILVNKTSF